MRWRLLQFVKSVATMESSFRMTCARLRIELPSISTKIRRHFIKGNVDMFL
jgi:hypothetical protein